MFLPTKRLVLEYHPPNHQLVGGTDQVDSFEELAELLGQVKPPTATKEHIDNSGLETLERACAPMCVDRCLICLEDYDPEEDPRLLSCRHVFHKDYVDRWRRAAITVPRRDYQPGSIPDPSST
ncbi:hypothetical protein EDB83DRAFT_2516430 [Lactarius deliciosus]|nr:hypothetical protein EDB83DRAFT_2516430 [Lactarius deliciosus]